MMNEPIRGRIGSMRDGRMSSVGVARIAVLALIGVTCAACGTDTGSAGADAVLGDVADTDAPDTDAPDTDAPDTDAPDTDAPDTTTADGGSSDVQSKDSGAVDAYVKDTGASDAGLTDAGASDAGPTDAGASDAGTSDAGPTDAGTPDIIVVGKNQCSTEVPCKGGLCYQPGQSIGCGMCQNPPNPCQKDDDCASTEGKPMICTFRKSDCTCSGEKLCHLGCVDDSTCGVGLTCDSGHHCSPKPCATAAACPSQFVCNAALCQRKACKSSAACASGVCVKGLCFTAPGFCSFPPP